MATPFKPERVEIFSKGAKVAEVSAKDSCNSLAYSIGYERSPTKQDCGQRTTVCPSGYTYYSGTFGACGPGCWKYVGGTVKTCGYTGWVYTAASQGPVLEDKWRHVVVVTENGSEVGRWNSQWFCYRTAAQQAEYHAATPSVTKHSVEWCDEGFLRCGNPCGEENSDWCCLNCQELANRINQLASAAEAIKKRFN